MTKKNILIVDDEVSILQVLKNSLKKQGDMYSVDTTSDGYSALEKLNEKEYHLVVTDYKMVGFNGLELLEAIRAVQPEIRVIMMTAYGTKNIEEEAERLNAHRFLHKPLEIDTFRQIVQEALEDVTTNHPGILVLSEERYRDVTHILEQLQNDIGARCTFLVDAGGQIIARTGYVQEFPIDAIASLLSGSVATLTEAGRAMDDDEDTINLAYREGKNTNIYGINIGHNLLMVLVIDRSKYSSKLGSVWYYAQSTARKLTQTINADDLGATSMVLDENSMQALDDEFEKLFSTNESEPSSEADTGEFEVAIPEILGEELFLNHVTETKAPASEEPKQEDELSAPIQTFNYEEAVKRGLIPADINDSLEEEK